MLVFRTVLCCLLLCFFSVQNSLAQLHPYDYVDPMIGTDYSQVYTRWGSEGGTYPGAVAPFGAVQLTPETGIGDQKGYHYQDAGIYYFTCLNHHSGYPSGSAGKLQVMPVTNPDDFVPEQTALRFLHDDETASPGYYKVLFRQKNILVEATAFTHTGMFRITFPENTVPYFYIGDAGELNQVSARELQGQYKNTLFQFDANIVESKKTADGRIYTFPKAGHGPTVLRIKLSTSSVSFNGSRKNLDAEINDFDFDKLHENTVQSWKDLLAIVTIDDPDERNKKKFYTALYHSMLLPWVISDVEGQFKGKDDKVYTTLGSHEYGGFSPWDTYRTLHPLITLLFPDRQHDMLLSMLNVYRQTGFLPIDPMTGNHAVPILVDSYLKGIQMDSQLIWEAMEASINQPPYVQPDLPSYQKSGYLSAEFAESVTRTVEYAYDDWALSQFALKVQKDTTVFQDIYRRSFGYRNLVYPASLFLLPKKDDTFIEKPGTFGYKEGDPWVYTYSVPQQPYDLINLLGGEELFSSKLDAALTNQDLVFDNETVLHVPYLFNYASRPDLTQKWTKIFMRERFNPSPGGLPGNDDLGSMSSWFVFSALGIYPTAPGRNVYDLGSPLFKNATLHLQDGKTFTVSANNNPQKNDYVQEVYLNGKVVQNQWITHQSIRHGGNLDFKLGNEPGATSNDSRLANVIGLLYGKPEFSVIDSELSARTVIPNESTFVRFTIQNSGRLGTKQVTLFVDGKTYQKKNILVPENGQTSDSISFRLYKVGKVSLQLDDVLLPEIKVNEPEVKMANQFEIEQLKFKPILKTGELQEISLNIKNIGWEAYSFEIPIILDGTEVNSEDILLEPGAIKSISHTFQVEEEGFHSLRVGQQAGKFKSVATPLASAVLALEGLKDISGFDNKVNWEGEEPEISNDKKFDFDGTSFLKVQESPSVNSFDSTLTLMAWIRPTEQKRKYMDLITKGDHHVMQITPGQSLNFFAGGWGRGECSFELPPNWLNQWHHIAGVCTGNSLALYLDGKLMSTTPLEKGENLSSKGNWAIGSNEEFPGERLFTGAMAKVKIFSNSLNQQEIQKIIGSESKEVISK